MNNLSKLIEVGLVGYGMAGQAFHAPIISSVNGLNLKTVVERHEQKAKDRYPWISSVKSVEELLADPELELVVIATPNATHFDYARLALEAGKHVVVDKPFTATSAEAKALIKLAQEKNCLLSVFQNRRWDGDFQTVRQLIEQGLLGRIVEVEVHYDRYINYLRPNTWKEEENPAAGIVFDLGSHLIDQAQVLFGLPKSVTADIRRQREESQIDDAFELILNYEKGIKVTLKAGMIVREKGPHFIVHGTNGSFVKYGLDPQEAALKLGLMPNDDPLWGQEPTEDWGELNTEANGLHFIGKVETIRGDYRAYYENIAAVLSQGNKLAVKPEEALNTIRIIELALDSQRQQRTLTYSPG
ncbi:oxidoreductase [Desulfosporosinus acidiphilus]|uniref:oxidoreductase n=1 Tax=Desulfosporosinus acidiphilus TaxID=885581 RepID=UPI003CFC991E